MINLRTDDRTAAFANFVSGENSLCKAVSMSKFHRASKEVEIEKGYLTWTSMIWEVVEQLRSNFFIYICSHIMMWLSIESSSDSATGIRWPVYQIATRKSFSFIYSDHSSALTLAPLNDDFTLYWIHYSLAIICFNDDCLLNLGLVLVQRHFMSLCDRDRPQAKKSQSPGIPRFFRYIPCYMLKIAIRDRFWESFQSPVSLHSYHENFFFVSINFR